MKEKLRSIFFAGTLLSMSLVNTLTPTKVFSNKENRYLQTFPDFNWDTILSSKFGKDFEKYATDQFIGRDNWIRLKTVSDLAVQKKDNGRVYFGKDGYLFNVDEEIDKEQFEKNIKYINTFIENLKQYNKDISITTLLVPSKEEILKDKLPLYAPVIDETSIIEDIKSSLKENINILDLIDVLNDKSDKYIYYKTDHHWTTKGAFYAYEYYLKSLGVTPISEDNFHIIEASNEFLGSNYRKANFYTGKPDKISVYKPKEDINVDIIFNDEIKSNNLYEESFLSKTDKYSYFLGGDKALININSSVRNGKSILVIKDSFANSFIPFLINHYENIYVIDPRYFNMSIEEFIKERGIDEVLFLFNIQNFVQEKSMAILEK